MRGAPARTRRAVTRRVDRRGALRRVTAYRVGRSQPNDEIAEIDRSVEQLRADVAGYDPPTGDTQELANWASIKHELNGLVLRWGQFKAALSDDWWWGDDDETALTGFRNEYNGLRKKVLDYTRARVTAPEVETPKEIDPNYKPPPPPPTDLTVKELLAWVAAIGIAGLLGYAFLQYKYGAYLQKLGGGGVRYASPGPRGG